MSTILFGFSFSGISFLIIAFLKSVNPSLILFSIFSSFSHLSQLNIIPKYLVIYIFLPAISSFINSYCNFDLDFLCLVDSGASSCVGSDCSRVEVLYKFFIGNNLLLKIFRTFSLALKNNP